MKKLNYQECITSHPSFIRVIIDYIIIALKVNGEIIIGDAPLQSCDFDALIRDIGLLKLVEFYKSKKVKKKIIDFRTEKIKRKLNLLFKLLRPFKTVKLSGDSNGYKIIDLGNESNLQEISENNGFKRFCVTNYNSKIMKQYHNSKRHCYLISNSLLQADVIIQLPKIKTHRKSGITACLKNIIGINSHKDWLPHHKTGSCKKGGDEYPYSNAIKRLYVLLTELNDLLLIR